MGGSLLLSMCSSREFPCLPHRWDFFQDPLDTPPEIPIKFDTFYVNVLVVENLCSSYVEAIKFPCTCSSVQLLIIHEMLGFINNFQKTNDTYMYGWKFWSNLGSLGNTAIFSCGDMLSLGSFSGDMRGSRREHKIIITIILL